jgi:hypothetical protein
MPGHRFAAIGDRHPAHDLEYANATDRETDNTLTVKNAREIALQLDDFSMYILSDWTIPTWVPIGSDGTMPIATAFDPAVDAAVTTAIIDANSGTVITLTTTGNSQTLGTPTNTTRGRAFFVINDGSSTDPIVIDGIIVQPGAYAKCYWDGSAWTQLGGFGNVVGAASSIDGNFALFDSTTGKLLKDDSINASSFDPAGAVAAHEGLADPHPVYLTSAEGDAAYDPLGVAASVQANLETHENNANNPHSVTASQAGSDPAGTALLAIAAHRSEPDATAHPTIDTRLDTAETHAAASNPHTGSGDVNGPTSSLDNEAPLFDGTTGKLLKGSGILLADILPATLDIGALSQAQLETVLDQDKAKRINAVFTEISSQQLTSTTDGDAIYTGTNPAVLALGFTITGKTSFGVNIKFEFYVAIGNVLNTIVSVSDLGGGQLLITTSLDHGYSNADRIIQENTTDYNDEYSITNVTAKTYEIAEIFVSTQVGKHAKILTFRKSGNEFSGQNKNTTLLAHIDVVLNSFIFLAVVNIDSAAEWETSDIHELYTRA